MSRNSVCNEGRRLFIPYGSHAKQQARTYIYILQQSSQSALCVCLGCIASVGETLARPAAWLWAESSAKASVCVWGGDCRWWLPLCVSWQLSTRPPLSSWQRDRLSKLCQCTPPWPRFCNYRVSYARIPRLKCTFFLQLRPRQRLHNRQERTVNSVAARCRLGSSNFPCVWLLAKMRC